MDHAKQTLKEPSSLESLLAEHKYKDARQYIDNVHTLETLKPILNDGHIITQERTELMDTIILHAFNELFKPYKDSNQLLLFATGGYGRKELVPNSDTDLMFVVPESLIDSDFSDIYGKFKTKLADARVIAEEDCLLKTMEDIETLDTKTISTFLDRRRLWGDAAFEKEVLEQISTIDIPTYTLDRFSHHLKYREKFPEGIHNVNRFNIKEGRGGLRDLHTALWLQSIKNFSPTTSHYAHMDKQTKEAVSVLQKARFWLNLHMQKERNLEKVHDKRRDEFDYNAFNAFVEQYGTENQGEVLEKIMNGLANESNYSIQTKLDKSYVSRETPMRMMSFKLGRKA